MKKKTIKFAPIINWGNKQLRRSDEYATRNPYFKSGICTMLEEILHKADRYEGFSFINNDDSEHGTLGYFTRRYYIDYLPGEEMEQRKYMARANDGFDVIIIRGIPDSKIITIEYPDGHRADVHETFLSFYSTGQYPTDHGFDYVKKPYKTT